MKSMSSDDENQTYPTNTKFIVAIIYLSVLIGVSFLPPGYGPKCTASQATPGCFTLQILFQWSWSYFTIYKIKHNSLLDLKNTDLEELLRSDHIIKGERKESVQKMRKDWEKNNDENIYDTIEGLDPAPKCDLVKMIEEQRKEYEAKMKALEAKKKQE